MHEKFDWYYVIPDTTYVNPFELMRFVNHVDWNRRVIIGVGSGDDSNRCRTETCAVPYPAVQITVHLSYAFILQQICRAPSQTYHWWKVNGLSESGSGTAIHDTVGWWASSSQNFNRCIMFRVNSKKSHKGLVFFRSLSVSPLLSDVDAHALHQHFLHVELNRTEYEIGRLSAEIVSLSYDINDGPSQPAGLPPYSKAPDRYQVPKWHFFTNTEIFKNEANQNVYALTGDDKLDVEEIVAAARKFIEESDEGSDEEFLQLRNGYRLFDPLRGMDYIVDLLYRNKYGGKVHRVHLTRIISNNQLLQQVPYVKEDTDLTILIPLGSNDEVGAVRRLIAHYVSLCQSSVGDNRQTRLIVAVRGVDPFVIRLINDDIIELRIRCKPAQTETMLLILKQDSHPIMAAAALDEAVDHFGQQMMYLLLSPHADIQHEFLDRVRLNTIKHFQVFFPLPFVEYHPRIVSANEALQSKLKGLNVERAHEMGDTDQKARSLEMNGADTFMSKFRDATFKRNTRPLIVHKDRGHFDPLDFSVFSLYGADFIQTRSRLNSKSLLLDLSSLFLGHQSIHMMRAIEPALRLRYHSRVCNPELVDTHYARCLLRRREGLASKAQLANLLLSRKARKMVIFVRNAVLVTFCDFKAAFMAHIVMGRVEYTGTNDMFSGRSGAGFIIQNGGVVPPSLLQENRVPLFYKEAIAKCGAASQSQLPDTTLVCNLMVTSCLPRAILGNIWSLVNRTMPGQLTRQEFFSYLALIALIQKGQPLSALSTMSILPIPHLQACAPFAQHLPDGDIFQQQGFCQTVQKASDFSGVAANLHTVATSAVSLLADIDFSKPIGNSTTISVTQIPTSQSYPSISTVNTSHMDSSASETQTAIVLASNQFFDITTDLNNHFLSKDICQLTNNPLKNSGSPGDIMNVVSNILKPNPQTTLPETIPPSGNSSTNINMDKTAGILESGLDVYASMKLITSVSEEREEERLYVWRRCIEEAYALLNDADSLLPCSAAAYIAEIVLTDRGSRYLNSLHQIYKMTLRIRKGRVDKLVKQKELLYKIDKIWARLEYFIEESINNEDANQLAETVNKTISSLCGICLLHISPNSILEFTGTVYHKQCANLWINRVDSFLPKLKEC
ncbi:unnamed protein product [Brugia timori]|nr:unnamed protein product [Brugia timori]